MATTYLGFDSTKPHGALLKTAVFGLINSRQACLDILATLTRMIDGDGSDPAQFSMMASQLQTPDNATAKAIWDEMNSLCSKFSGNGSVDSVAAAINQIGEKLR